MRRIEDAIGHTPLLHAIRLQEREGLVGNVLLKLEMQNPGGSVKDRAALYMINAAEEAGILQPGGTMVEPTSGNTGIGLSMVAKARGYRLILTMPETMSVERRQLLAAYGAELVLTPGGEGMPGAIKRAEQIVAETPGAFIVGQFENPANAQAHVETTSVELWAQTGGEIAAFVAGIGTGGTITGVGKGLKNRDERIQIIGVEPAESPFLTEGKAGSHKIQGIGAGFRPTLLDTNFVDEICTAGYEDAIACVKLLRDTEAILCGISGGAALCVGLALARMPQYKGENIIVLLPDSGERYLSMGIFD
ncbi:cysteine synthase A [Eubacteriales bacterium OttesenSCG-928-M02]|nr:cysteine synthase A [Eubacteriales bacterium OttesenSCG-928-M02]